MTEHRYVGMYEIPLEDFLSIRVERSSPTAIVKMDLTPNARGAVAPVHGGALSTLADTACGTCLGDAWDAEVEFPVSVDLHVRYYRQPTSSPLIAEATLVHDGRKIMGAECVITDGDGRQIARASGTYMIVKGFGDTATGEHRSRKPDS